MPTTDALPVSDAAWARALRRAEQRRRGVAAHEPVPADDALTLYRPLLEPPAQAMPWLIAHLGQSLDGCVATRSGDSCFVTGEQNLTHLHRLRALSDAVIVGAGTVAADDPQLTTRRVPGPHPLRVVIDARGTLSARARVFTDGQAPTLRLCDSRWVPVASGSGHGVEVLALAGLLDGSGRLDARIVVQALAARGLRVLFVEGGGITVSRFFEQRCLDRLHLAIAPVLIGDGRRGLQLGGFETMDDCLRPSQRTYRMGDDVLWDLELPHSHLEG